MAESATRRYLFADAPPAQPAPRSPAGWLKLRGISRHNLHQLDVELPLGVLAAVTGVSGSGKSTLVSQVLPELVLAALGHPLPEADEADPLEQPAPEATEGHLAGGLGGISRLVQVNQQPIGRTPRSNLATYTGLFDPVRALFASTPLARQRRYDAGRFSFNVAKGRCPHCQGEGQVMVELLFLPSVYAPCPVCQGARYNPQTLEITYRAKNIADVLGLTVDAAWAFFEDEPPVRRALIVLREVGLGYLRLGQPATELSGGEAQRVKLATELQRAARTPTLYVLDEPTTGLHPADVERLLVQLRALVAAGHSVVVVEHNLPVIAAADWVLDIGPGAGDEGGRVVAAGPPAAVAASKKSALAKYLRAYLGE